MPLDNTLPERPETPCIDFARAVAASIRDTDNEFSLLSWCGCNLGHAVAVAHGHEVCPSNGQAHNVYEQDIALRRLGFDPTYSHTLPMGWIRPGARSVISAIQGCGLRLHEDPSSPARREQCARLFDRLAQTGTLKWTEKVHPRDDLEYAAYPSEGIRQELAWLSEYNAQCAAQREYA